MASALRPSAFLDTVIAFLLPYFAAAAQDASDARDEVIETLISYAARSRSELLHAAHIIAFSMTSLQTLAEASTIEMPMPMRLRHRSCANGLNRTMLQSEKSLGRSLAREVPVATGEPLPDPVDDEWDTQIHAAIKPVPSTPATHPDRLTSAPSAGPNDLPPREARNKQLWAGAMMETLRQMGLPVESAPLHPIPGKATPNDLAPHASTGQFTA
jgi:hypothetical protein